MATRVIAAQDKTTSGAGDDVQIKAGNANTSGAGGNIILQPGVQVTTGGNGTVQVIGSNQTLKIDTSSITTTLSNTISGYLVFGSNINFVGASAFVCDPSSSQRPKLDSTALYGYSTWGLRLGSSNTINWTDVSDGLVGTMRVGLTYGSYGQIRVTDASTGGGSFAYTSSTPTALSTNPTNDLVLAGSAFQRLSSSSALSLTGIAPPSSGSHVDGRLIWLYNVGSFNITLKHSQTSVAGNQFVNEGGGDIVLGPNRVVQAIYDSTTGKWRVNGETYPYVFPTTDGTNGQVLTTNGSGTLSWSTVSAGASANGTTGYISKFTASSTLGNSSIYENATGVAIGTTSPSTKFHVYGGTGLFETGGTSTKGLIVKAASSQTANLAEWQDSSGTALSNINAAGAFSGPLATSSASFDNNNILLPSSNILWSNSSATGGLSSPVNGTFQKVGGSSAWDFSVYSKDSYYNNVICSFKAGQTNLSLMFGLDANPTSSNSYTDIDYAWYIKSDGTLEIYENGATAGSFGSYTTSTIFAITYDGTNIKYWKDGVVVRTVAATLYALYFDSSFYSPGAKVTDVKFGPIGQPYRIWGSTGYLSKFNDPSSLTSSNLYESGGSVGIGSQFIYAKLHVQSDSASTACIHVVGANGQTNSLQEWQNNSTTTLAKIDNVGRFVSSYNSGSSLSTFSVGKTVIGGVHFNNGAGSGTSARNEAAITFRGDVATEAQAGIYVTNDNSTGTHMAFATTDSYATGPQLGLTISNAGVVNFPRARPTYAGASLTSTAGGTANYVGKFSDSATVANSQIFDNGTNIGLGTATNLSDKVNIYETSAPVIRFQSSGNQYGARIGFWAGNQMQIQCATANLPIVFLTAGTVNDSGYERMRIKHDGLIGINESNPGGLLQITTGATTKGLIVKGAASQSANLTEWQDSTGTVVAAVSPNGAFTGSSFTPYGTFNSTTTIFGNNYWTPNLTNVSNPSTGTFTKNAGTDAQWNAQVYSSEGYTKNVYCAARASQTTGFIMFGFNSDPTTDANYSSLDYVWYCQGDGTLAIVENNVQVATYGTYTTSTVLSITYDGSNVQYWKDGVLQRTTARSTGNPLYFDTSFYTLNASINSVQFGPIGQPFGISGTSGYLPKFTSQQTIGNSNVNVDSNAMYVSGQATSDLSGQIMILGSSDNRQRITMGVNTTSGYGYIQSYLNTIGNYSLALNPQGGNVGIGTASPGAQLQVTASAAATKGLIVRGAASQSANLQEWQNSAGSNLLRVTSTGSIVSDATNTDFIIGQYNGAGIIYQADNNGHRFQSWTGSWVDNMVIQENGNVGIGTASPSYKLQVDAASVNANIVANVTSGYGGIGVFAAGTNKVVLGYAGANANYGSQTIAGDVALKTNNTNFHINTGSGNSVTTAYFSSAGNVGIGNVSPGARLQVDTGATGTKGLLLKAAASQTANLLEVQNSAGTVLTNIDSGGNITVATTSSAYTYYSTNTTTRWATGHDSSNGYFRIVDYVWDGTTRLMITPGGNVVLGNAGGDQTNGPKLLVTTGPDTSGGTGAARKGLIVRGSASQTANLQEWQNSSSTALAYMDANGNFFAVSKSFLIDHPTPAKAAEGKKLRYASLEGPENGVYFRGTLTGDNEIILPDYWKDLVDPESITVNLTPRKRPQPNLFVVDANAEKVVVESDREICCDFIVYGTRKDIAKLEVEVNGD